MVDLAHAEADLQHEDAVVLVPVVDALRPGRAVPPVRADREGEEDQAWSRNPFLGSQAFPSWLPSPEIRTVLTPNSPLPNYGFLAYGLRRPGWLSKIRPGMWSRNPDAWSDALKAGGKGKVSSTRVLACFR